MYQTLLETVPIYCYYFYKKHPFHVCICISDYSKKKYKVIKDEKF